MKFKTAFLLLITTVIVSCVIVKKRQCERINVNAEIEKLNEAYEDIRPSRQPIKVGIRFRIPSPLDNKKAILSKTQSLTLDPTYMPSDPSILKCVDNAARLFYIMDRYRMISLKKRLGLSSTYLEHSDKSEVPESERKEGDYLYFIEHDLISRSWDLRRISSQRRFQFYIKRQSKAKDALLVWLEDAEETIRKLHFNETK